MKVLAFLFCLLFTMPLTATSEPVVHVRTFFLEGVRSGRLHGPFIFRTGTRIKLDTGTFRIDVLSATGNFILTQEPAGAVFGVYELIPGRIIDAGYQLFTITRISETQIRDENSAAPTVSQSRGDHVRAWQPLDVTPSQKTYKVGVIADLVQQIYYNPKIDKQAGGSATFIDRRSATLFYSRGILTLKGGILADAEWDKTLEDPAGRFQDGTIVNGKGWIAGIEMQIPVFRDGYWTASIGGGLFHQRESFDLEYGNWQTPPPTSVTNSNNLLNGATNGIPEESAPIVMDEFVRQSTTATLTETWISLTAQIDYITPNWFAFAGLKAFPWMDTDLRATIEVDNQRIPLTFERKDPLSGYAGIGLFYQDVNSYVAFEAGGVNAIRIGIILSF